MKKTTLLFIMVTTICIALCACGKEEVKQNLNSENKLLAIQMKMNIEEATLSLSDANEAVIASMGAKDEESGLTSFKEALNLVKSARTKVDTSISSPNFISKGLEELEKNYEETISLLSRLSELSEEENDELVNLLQDGTSKHILLSKVLNASSYLCEIRYFDQSPEAERNLKDSWWTFGFNEEIECPETIDEQELYLIWAKQFFEDFDEDKFLEKLQVLRANDDLSSLSNQKWTELIEIFMSQAKDRSS